MAQCNKRLIRRWHDRRGTTAVEFALIAPLLFLVVFASIEFGRAMMAIHSLEEAAREGCRVGIVEGATATDMEDAVENMLSEAGITNYTLTLDPASPGSAEQWGPITVTVTTGYGSVSWLPTPSFLQNVTLSGTCTMPREGKKTT